MIVNDEFDILERFISCELTEKKAKVKRIIPKQTAFQKQKTKALETYATENAVFRRIDTFD